MLFDNGAGTSPTGSTTAGDPYPGLRTVLLGLPDPGHDGSHLVPRAGRHAQRTAADARRGSTRTPRTRAPLPLTDYSDQHRHRRAVGQRVAVGMELGAAPGGLRRVLRLGAADERHHRDRRRRRRTSGCESSTPDVDLQATISEVRPDGNETFVQNGWIRASERKLATNSNNMFKQAPHAARADPDLPRSRRAADAGGPVRPGRRSRSTSRATPTARARASGSRSPRPTARSRCGRSARRSRPAPPRRCRSRSRRSMPSSLILPVVPGVSVPTALPACPSLRNEPCRPYQAFVNNGS